MNLNYFEARKKIKSGLLYPAYLFYGEETFLGKDLLQLLTATFLGEDSFFGLEKVEGDSLSLSEAVQRLTGGNLFAPRQLLVVERPSYLAPPRSGRPDAAKGEEKGEEVEDSGQSARIEKESLEQLERFMARESAASPQNIIVFVCPTVDRRKKIFKLIDSKGLTVDCSPLNREDLARWIRERVALSGKTIARDALEQLLWSGSGDLWHLATELDKYITYLDETQNTITGEVVELLYAGDTQGNVFNLADALGEGNLNRALNLLQQLLERREKPLQIFFMLARHFRLLLAAWEARRENITPNTFANEEKLQPFVAKKLYQQVSGYSQAALEAILLALQSIDRSIKTGAIDPQSALELTLSRIHHIYTAARKSKAHR
ncbi:MAG TPA: DNA polymerase III subunit delta [Bacillota bacterium]|nr:DNA polymerase III subunit delta [Bacillota bacterium]